MLRIFYKRICIKKGGGIIHRLLSLWFLLLTRSIRLSKMNKSKKELLALLSF
jgi:hypothetical protein